MGTATGPGPEITGVILAGGKATRMNSEDKPLLELGGRPIIEHIVASATPQVSRLAISVNRHPEKYTTFGLPLVPDCIGGNAGPLAGILSVMNWCRTMGDNTQFIACFPGDVPLFPPDVVPRLLAEVETTASDVGWLRTDGQLQPLFSLWSLDLLEPLQRAISEGIYSPMQFIHTTRHVLVEINHAPAGHFENLNTPEDILRARQFFVGK